MIRYIKLYRSLLSGQILIGNDAYDIWILSTQEPRWKLRTVIIVARLIVTIRGW